LFTAAPSSVVYAEVTVTSENSAVTPSVAKKPIVFADKPSIVCVFTFSSEKSAVEAT